MYSFPNDPLQADLRDLASRLVQVSSDLGDAVNWVKLADQHDWVSPAATAYGSWIRDLYRRCADLQIQTDDLILSANTWRSRLISVAYG
ncbi:MAG: hypothetical protein LBH68_01825 [Bifidobacteriaceae bacterium]|nr:hypothetical protein [Bifidobacteriaceae bacterium]